MGRPVILAENFFNPRLFTSHALTASEEATGHEVELIGSGRRSKELNHWTSSTANTAAWVKAACDRIRAADMIAIDRGHNLAGKVVRVQGSNDDSTYVDVAAITIPSTVYAYQRLDEAPGVKTEEGAWLYRFPTHAWRYWRVYFDAMGAGLKPEIVGLHLGLAFSTEFPEVKPFSHGLRELDFEETKAPSAWVGAGQKSQRRRKRLHLKLKNRLEAALARYHVEELVLRGKPYWYVPDDDEAEKAWFACATQQTAGLEIAGDWSEYQIAWDAYEQEPKLIA